MKQLGNYKLENDITITLGGANAIIVTSKPVSITLKKGNQYQLSEWVSPRGTMLRLEGGDLKRFLNLPKFKYFKHFKQL